MEERHRPGGMGIVWSGGSPPPGGGPYPLRDDTDTGGINLENNTTACGTNNGSLPGTCAPLVFPYVPMQEKNPATYDKAEALEKGTLFPGLYLPFFREMRSRFRCARPELCELMAMDFALAELGLYLDTHQDDQEAFALFQKYAALYRQGRAAYEAKYGPLQQTAAAEASSYTWLQEPWPWEMTEGGKA